MNKVLFSRNSDNWATPKAMYDFYIRNDYFDPCPLNSNFDGLEIEWKEKNFVNPPYSKIKQFVDKSIEEHIKGKTNCKNEDLIISELIDLCDYKDEVFKQNQEKNKEIERLNKIIDIKTNRIQQLMKRLSKRQEKVDRLNNIIEELEKDMRETIEIIKNTEYQKIDIDYVIETLDIYCNRLKELKESKANLK